MKTVFDNFDYQGPEQNFSRDAFKTLEAMRTYPDSYLPEMFDAFCYETRKKYRYDKSNSTNNNLGKWREIDDCNCSLPTASEKVKGGIKVGEGLTMDNDTLSVTPLLISDKPENVIHNTRDGLYVPETDLSDYVKKETGKGLSSLDFTPEMKNRYDKAERNVQSDWNEIDNESSRFIKNKPALLSDFSNDKGFINNTVDNLTNYYLKNQVYTKSEVKSLIMMINKLSFIFVDELPSTDIRSNVIYLIKEGKTCNQYFEINGTLECIGSTSFNTDLYYTKQQADELFVQKEAGKKLSTEDFTSSEKLKLESLKNYDDSDIKTRIKKESEDREFQFAAVERGLSLLQTLMDNMSVKINELEDKVDLYERKIESLEIELSNEISYRQKYHKIIEDRIVNIEEIIPGDVSVDNKLVDTDTLNSSIATSTAKYQGIFTLEEEFPENANLNDYLFYRRKDNKGNIVFIRYKWNGSKWLYEYQLNNSTFTNSQMKALSSGISEELVSQISTSKNDILELKELTKETR